MLKFLILAGFLFLSACSHVSIVKIGEGERSKTIVKSCAHQILLFPLNPEDGSSDGILSKYSLSPKDIYSVDVHSWYYLVPFYFNYCYHARLNQEGENKYLKLNPKVENITPQEQPTTIRNTRSKTVRFENVTITDIKDCDQFRTLKRDRCVEFLNKQLKE